MGTLSLTKEARIYSREKTISLTIGSGKTGQSFVNEWNKNTNNRGSSQPRDRIHIYCISCVGRQILKQNKQEKFLAEDLGSQYWYVSRCWLSVSLLCLGTVWVWILLSAATVCRRPRLWLCACTWCWMALLVTIRKTWYSIFHESTSKKPLVRL